MKEAHKSQQRHFHSIYRQNDRPSDEPNVRPLLPAEVFFTASWPFVAGYPISAFMLN